MPMYYFHLRNNETIADVDGTELADHEAARMHAERVARELKFHKSDLLNEGWSSWTMVVHDGEGTELFSFPMAGFGGDGGA